MPKLFKRTTISIKTEGTQGTTAAPVAIDYIFVEGLEVGATVEKLTRDPNRSYLDPVSQLVGKRNATVKFKVEMKGANEAITGAPALTKIAPLSASLVACGLSGVWSLLRTGVSGINFYPTSDAVGNYQGPGQSCTIVVNRDGIEHIVKGSLGTFKMMVEAGKIAYGEFDFKGEYVAPTDVAVPVSSPAAHLPPIVQSSTFYIHGFAPVASKFELDAGIVVSERPDINSANGLLGFVITDRQAKGSLDPETPTLANQNVWASLIAGTTGAVSGAIGSEVGNIIEYYCPSVQYSEVSYADRNGILTYNTPLTINGLTGNDSFRITFR